MVFSSEMVFSFSSERFIPFPASALAVALAWFRSRRALINRLRARRVGAALRMLCDGFGTSDVQRGWIATSCKLFHRQFRLSRPFAPPRVREVIRGGPRPSRGRGAWGAPGAPHDLEPDFDDRALLDLLQPGPQAGLVFLAEEDVPDLLAGAIEAGAVQR